MAQKRKTVAGGAARVAGSAVKGTWKIGAFVANFILPGVGTFLLGRIGTGIIQLCLMLVGVLTLPFGFGIFILLGTWVWGLVLVTAQKSKPQVIIIREADERRIDR